MNLTLWTSVLGTNKYVANITPLAKDTWRRSIVDQGGYWLGSFEFTGDVTILTKWFYEYLGSHFREDSNGQNTWEGMIYSMDLTIGGITRRRTFEEMWNRINILDSADAATDYDNTASQTKYGIKTQMYEWPEQTTTAAAAQAQTKLREAAWPWARVIGIEPTGDGYENQLSVTVCGYAFTMNWRYQSVGDGTNDNLSDWISETVAADCEYISSSVITANTLSVKKEALSNHLRPWEIIQMVTGFGDASYNQYRSYVGNDRVFYYQPIDTMPRYYLRDGQLYTSPARNVSAIDPYSIHPCVVRDLDYPVISSEYNGWLDDARDIWISEVEVGPDGLKLKSVSYEESEIIAAYADYMAAQETEAAKGGGRTKNKKRDIEKKKQRIGQK